MRVGAQACSRWPGALLARHPRLRRRSDSPARAVLEQAAEAMGGLERLQGLDNVVLTGFGQRVYYQGGGFMTGEEKAPPKWQALADVQRTFDLPGERALNQERWAQEFPFAGFFGLNFARNSAVQTGDAAARSSAAGAARSARRRRRGWARFRPKTG